MKILYITLSALTASPLLSYGEVDRYRVDSKMIVTPKLTNPIQASTTMSHKELMLVLRKLSEIEGSDAMTAPSIVLPANTPGKVKIVRERTLKKLNQPVTEEYGQQLSLLIDTTTPKLRVKGVNKSNSFILQDEAKQIEVVTTASDEVIFDAAFTLGDSVVIADKDKLIILTVSKFVEDAAPNR